jgi:hypothetical protein
MMCVILYIFTGVNVHIEGDMVVEPSLAAEQIKSRKIILIFSFFLQTTENLWQV